MDRISWDLTYRGISLTISYYKKKVASDWVLLLHGLQSYSDQFLQLATQPFLSSYSLLAVDFIGFGHSSASPEFSYDLKDQAEVITRLLRHEGIDRASIIGHSMGGMVGTLLLSQKNLTVTRLASLEGNLRPEDGDASREIRQWDRAGFENEYFPELLKRLKSGKKSSEVFRAKALGRAFPLAVFASAQSIARYADQGIILKNFRETTLPRCLIRGSESHFGALPPECHCSEWVIPQSGHFVLLDNPEKTFEALESFFRQTT